MKRELLKTKQIKKIVQGAIDWAKCQYAVEHASGAAPYDDLCTMGACKGGYLVVLRDIEGNELGRYTVTLKWNWGDFPI